MVQKGELGRAIAAFPWERTPLGALATWPPHLRLTVNLMLEAGAPMAVIWGPEHHFLYNERYAQIIQDKHPSALGAPAREVFPEIWSTLAPLFDKTMSGDAVLIEDFELPVTRSGVTKPGYFSFSYNPIRGDHGRVDGFLAVVVETTARVMREQERAQVFDTVLSAIADFAYTFDRQGRFVYVNRALLDLWGLDLPDAVGKNFFDLGYPDDLAARLQKQIQQVVAENITVRDETRYVSPSGVEGFYEYIFSPVLAPAGSVQVVAGSTRDITERKQLELGVHQSEQGAQRQRRLYEAVLSNTPDLVYVFDLNHRFTYANSALLAMWGRTAEEAIGKNCLELGYEPWHAAMHDREIEQVIATKRLVRGDVKFSGTNGTRWYDYIFSPVIGVTGEVEAIAGTTRDVTDQRKAADSARFLGDLAQTLAVISGEREIVRHTVAAIGRRLDAHRCGFIECLESENLAKVGESWVRDGADPFTGALNLDDFSRPHWWRDFSGGGFSFEDIEGDPLIGRGEAEKCLAAGIRSGAVQLIKQTGKWMVLLAVADSRPRKWNEDELRMLESVGTRVWPLVERARANASLRAARDEALAASQAKDNFLAALSHELRTPLNPVLLLATDAAEDPDLPEGARADFKTIAHNVALEARLIDDLLDLSRITHNKLSLDLKSHDIHALLQRMLATFEPDLSGKQLVLTRRMEASRSVVVGDELRLQQIFLNLLRNAVKFTPAGGRIDVSTRVEPNGPDQLAIEISDTGIGLTAEELARIFTPFSQGEHAGDERASLYGGLGLGLSISRRIAELHSGSITARSPGRDQGTTFLIRLPLQAAGSRAATVDRAPITAPKRKPANACRSVLLIEDHDPSRQALSRLLTNRGMEVAEASTAAEALEKARTQSFDLVISDIGLPDLSGYDLMSTLQAKYGMRGIALSGFGTKEDIARSYGAGFVSHLTKPIQIQALENALKQFTEE